MKWDCSVYPAGPVDRVRPVRWALGATTERQAVTERKVTRVTRGNRDSTDYPVYRDRWAMQGFPGKRESGATEDWTDFPDYPDRKENED